MPDRPHVVLVVAEVAGGIAAHVRSLAAELDGLDVKVTVIGPCGSLGQLGLDRSTTYAVATPVGRPTPWAWWAVRRQLRRLATGGSVVHAHGLRAAAAPGRRPDVPLVVTWHNAALGSPAWRRVHGLLERRVARRATVVLAASADLAARARAAGATDVRAVLIGSPEARAPVHGPEQVRESLGLEPDVPLVLAVGRLQRQKRLDVLIEAAAGWPHSGPGARRVLVAGEGPSRAALAAQIERTGAPVTLLGVRDDVPDLLAAADVVVLTSEWEARALVAQEAMRYGVPLVCTGVGGLPDLVADAAIVVPVGDALAVRTAVDRLLSEPELRADLVRRARQRAAGWPSVAETAAELQALYIDLT